MCIRSWEHSRNIYLEYLACVGAFQDESRVAAECLGRSCEHVTATASLGSVAASLSRHLEVNAVETAVHCLLRCAPGGTWVHVMAALLPCWSRPRMRSHMETSPGEASFSSTNSSSPTQSYTGHEELDGPSDKIVREIEKGKIFLEG